MTARGLVAIVYFVGALFASACAEAGEVRPFGWPSAVDEAADLPISISAAITGDQAEVTLSQNYAASGNDGNDRFFDRWVPAGAAVLWHRVSTQYGVTTVTTTYRQEITRTGQVNAIVLPTGPDQSEWETTTSVASCGVVDDETPGWLCTPPAADGQTIEAMIEIDTHALAGLWSDTHDFDLIATDTTRIIEITTVSSPAALPIALGWIVAEPVTAMVTTPRVRP